MLERFFEVDPWVDIPLVGPSDPIGTSSKSLDHMIPRPLNLSRSDLIKTYVKPNRPVINPPNHEGGRGAKKALNQANMPCDLCANASEKEPCINIDDKTNNIQYGRGRDIHGIDKFSDISHDNTCFVDDVSSVVGFKHKSQILAYIRDYMEMMNLFYACNKLRLNPSKSHFCISGSKAQIDETLQFSLRLDNE